MGKTTKKKAAREKSLAAASIFDFIKFLTETKKPWEELTESDKKAFSPFMVTRWLSMNTDLTCFVNDLQKYTIGVLTPKHTYKLYLDLLPKQRLFLRYIKGKSDKVYNASLIDLIKTHYQINSRIAVEYLDIFYSNDLYKSELISIIMMYGKNEKECQKLLNLT